MKAPLLVIFIIVTSLIRAQNLVDLYEDYFPKQLLQEVESRKSIEYNLNLYSNIHPDLIYYYIKYINSFVIDRVLNPDSNYSNLLKHYRYEYSKERSKWAANQINSIENYTSVRLKRSAMKNLYEDVMYNQKDFFGDIPQVEKDVNLQEFFNYVYYSQQKWEYDKTLNYFQLNKERTSILITEFNRGYDNFGSFSHNDKIQKVKKDIKYWYLIGGASSYKYETNTVYQTSELSIQTFDKSFLNKSFLIIGMTYGWYLRGIADIHKYYSYSDKPLPTFLKPISFDFTASWSYHPTYSIELGYQLAIRDEVAPFSYLKLLAGKTFFTSEYTDLDEGKTYYAFTYHVITGSERLQYQYRSDGLQNKKNYFGFGRIATPVLYLSKNVYFEFGVDLSFRYSQFDYRILKLSVRQKNDEDFIESAEIIDYPYKETELNFSPSLSLIINPQRNFNITIHNSKIWKSYVIGFGFNILI
jgi:hypothetical protein